MTAPASRFDEDLEHLAARYSTDLLTVHTADGTFLYASGEAVPLLGIEPEVLRGRKLQELVLRNDRDAVEEELGHIEGHETRRLRYRVSTADGTHRLVETRLRKSPPFLIGSTREIDDYAPHERTEWIRLKTEARTDWLTRLPNRWGLEEALETEMDRYLRSGHAFSMAMLDIDGFKAVNDVHGHPFGDHVLRRVAALIERGRRSYDILGRWGGDEFLLVLPETSTAEAEAVAQRMIAIVAAEFLHDRHVTLSGGVATSSCVATIDTLVEVADRAMYRAKALGGNRVCVE